MDNDFQRRLLATFRVETKEHLNALSAGLLELEKATEHEKRQKILEAVSREAHSLKGAARAVSASGIEALSHALESAFAAVRRETVHLSPELFDLFHRTIDAMEQQLSTLDGGVDSAGKSPVEMLVSALNRAVQGSLPSLPSPVPGQSERQESLASEKPPMAGTVRISAGKLDALLHQAEEMLTAKLAAVQRGAELEEICGTLALWEKEWKKARPVVRTLRKAQQVSADRPLTGADAGLLGKLLTFLDWGHSAVLAVEQKVHKLAQTEAHDRHFLNGMVDALLDDAKEVLMLPCATILEALPRMVRDLARDGGKEAELAISGETVQIDKRVLEEMKDPLIHLLRNCIDHGIEKPAERERLNKPPRGRIAVAVSLNESSRIEITVSDDGGGIDTARVAETAVRHGILSTVEAGRLGREGLRGLVFASGVSTSPLITDMSGRGLGLAIVREKVEKLGGTIALASEPGEGTTFRMTLPLTLFTYRGVLVRAGEQTFVVPTAGVERVARVDKAALKTVENRETVALDGEPLSFVRLADVLRLPRGEWNGADSGLIPLLVIGSGGVRIAFGVDGVLDEREILVKSLGPQLSRVRNIAGATVLGTGKVATILHPGDLVKSAVQGAFLPAGAAYPMEKPAAVRTTVLIVEDSITARTLLKNILETAGYRTMVAIDGVDALTTLRTEQIDLVVSDVDMPRMNGFELTGKIRGSRELADLPVVLVTSLDSREDRERGIEVGANAYIVKSSFDQSNLLEAVKRLI